MRFLRYLLLISILVVGFSSKSYQRHKQIPPYYQLEIQGLNYRIENGLSDFDNSAYIEKQIDRFRRRWALQGVSLAVVKDEKLVYAQGFGHADRSGEQVQPGNLFRVASVSKLLTGIAIMKLVEDGKLKLDDTVFGPNAILQDSVFNKVRDRKIYNITVRQLLAHSGGWSQRYGDPAFNSLSVARKVDDPYPATINSYYKFIASRRLNYPPGTRVSYSNMGYMFLGEVIAQVSGQSYENYIRDNILIPNGIIDMHIGHSYSRDKRTNEVDYFEAEGSRLVKDYAGSDQLVAKSDGGNPIELLGAAGGWICSAVELARLVTLVDGKSEVADILSDASIAEMVDNTYAKGPLGWKSTYGNGSWVRTGSMAGTSAMIKRMDNGLTWIFISNTSSWKGSLLSSDINSLMFKICSRVKEWPEVDLFHYYPIHNLPMISAK